MEVKAILIKFFHFIGILHYAYAIFYDVVYVFPEEVKIRGFRFGHKFIYLTFNDTVKLQKYLPKVKVQLFFSSFFQILQLVYFCVAFVNDFIGSNEVEIKKRPLITRARDYIFSSLALPLAFQVGVMFWSLFIIDRDLVAPKVWDAIFPIWLNHFIHTDIMIFIAIEMIIVYHHYPTIKNSLLGLIAFMLVYVGWEHIIYVNTGKWVYPVLASLNWAERIGFHMFNIAIPVGFYFLGRFLNNRFWNKTRVIDTIQKAREEKLDIGSN